MACNKVYSHSQLLHSEITFFFGFMVNVNNLKNEAAGKFRSLNITTRIHSGILHTPTDRRFLDQDIVMKEEPNEYTNLFGKLLVNKCDMLEIQYILVKF